MELPELWQKERIIHNEQAMRELGAELAAFLPLNTTVGLSGPLGSGKTTFAKGFAEAIGISTTVKSPTFQYLILYEAPHRKFLHLDAYRLGGIDDYDSLLIEDLLDPPWTLLVEWPENVLDALPQPMLHLQFSNHMQGRRVQPHLQKPQALL